MRALAILASLLVIALCGCAPHKSAQAQLYEASANFESADLAPFFKRIQPIFEAGFSENDIKNVVTVSKSLKVHDEREFDFVVRSRGKDIPFKINVVMHDIDAPDIYCRSTQEIAQRIQQEMAAYSAEHGR